MNEFLAELYGTREAIGSTEDSSDVEKLAEAQILDNVLQSEGINVDDLDDGTILKLAHEIFGDESEIVKSAMEEDKEPKEPKEEVTEEEPKKEEGEGESTEKNAADADLMGRIMAHSMVQELGQIEIEKEAQAGTAAKGLLKALGGAAKEAPGKAGKWLKAPGETYKALRTPTKLHPGSKGIQTWGPGEAAKATAKRHKGQAAVAGAAAAGATGAGITALKGKKKKASAIDTLAEHRALEILAENGIEPQAEETKLASTIEQRAWEMLSENGYVQEE